MLINELVWFDDRIEHIAKHHVQPDEVEDVCFGTSLVLRSKSKGKNPVYYILGQTLSGKYLLCVIIHFPDGKGYPVTAREMNRKEKKKFMQWRNK
jgi:hypothetical protein